MIESFPAVIETIVEKCLELPAVKCVREKFGCYESSMNALDRLSILSEAGSESESIKTLAAVVDCLRPLKVIVVLPFDLFTSNSLSYSHVVAGMSVGPLPREINVSVANEAGGANADQRPLHGWAATDELREQQHRRSRPSNQPDHH